MLQISNSSKNLAAFMGWTAFGNFLFQSLAGNVDQPSDVLKSLAGGAAIGAGFCALTSFSENERKRNYYPNPRLIYQGVKKWGTLQQTKSRNLHPIELVKQDNLGLTGAQRLAELWGKGEKYCKLLFERFPGSGVRFVLSNKDNLANQVLNNFYTGEKSKLSFGVNHHLSKELSSNPTFQNYFKYYLKAVGKMISSRSFNSNLDAFFQKENKLPNFSVVSEIPSYDYYGLMGGVQQIEVHFAIYQLNERQFKVDTRMFIRDSYCADKEDIEGFFSIKAMSQSLPAFYVLQNCFGCHPFITEIVYEHSDVIFIA